MPDEKPESAAGQIEAEDESSEEQPGSQPDITDGSEEGEEQRVPLRRFKEVNAKFRQAASVADWYRQNIGDPNDVVEFRKWKETQARAAASGDGQPESTTKQPLTPAQLKAVRDLMRDADPEYREMLDAAKERQAERQQNEEAMFDDAHDALVQLAKDNGLNLDEPGMVMLGQQVMLAIRHDAKLLRAWDRGDIGCVEKAFGKVNESFLSKIAGKKAGALRQKEAATRRRISQLPTAPSGGAATTHPVASKSKDEKGITNKTHDRAWALLQQTMNE
jgi:hypothetical protein